MYVENLKKADSNIVPFCYNQSNLISNMVDKMQPGRTPKAEAPNNLFNTWLEYRLSKDQTKADLIREVNAAVDRKYDNDRFYKWSMQKLTVAENVLLTFIYPELPEVLKHFYSKNGYPTSGIDFDFLAESIRPAVKNLPKKD